MSVRQSGAFVLLFTLLALPVCAGELVPLHGTWSGSTISATFVAPNIVLVVAEGPGIATHLGSFTMTSPHLTFLDTFAIDGTQNFVAANGDALNAQITGHLAPNADGNLEGILAGVITGGSGRFEGASGTYDFHIVAVPAAFGFNSTATIDGVISSVGSNR